MLEKGVCEERGELQNSSRPVNGVPFGSRGMKGLLEACGMKSHTSLCGCDFIPPIKCSYMNEGVIVIQS